MRLLCVCVATMSIASACASPSGSAASVDGGGSGTGHDGGSGSSGSDGAVPSSNVTILVEPNGNDGAELITAIDGATTSVYMTMYQLDKPDVIAALIARKHAGLDVQVILDSSTTNKSWNTPAYNQLHAAQVDVVWSSPSFNFTHEKCVMIDGKQAWIMTMNANKSPPSTNREYLAIDNDPSDVAEAIAIFHADHAMQAVTPSGALVVADVNARPKLVQLIGTAAHTLDIEVEEFSDTYSTGVTSAVVQASNRGVAVRIVIANDSLTSSQTASNKSVKMAGGKIVMTGPTSSSGTGSNPYIHAKAILVDCVAGACASGFVGSENFSGGSLGYNRELGVIIDDPTELAKVSAAFETDFARGVAQ